MSDNLVLALLEAIRGDIGKFKTDMIEVKERLGLLEQRRSLISRRLDRLGVDVEAIRRRLDLVDAE